VEIIANGFILFVGQAIIQVLLGKEGR
jgi:hypothetical protein